MGTCLVVADVGVAGISELSHVAGAGGTVDSTSSSRRVPTVSMSIVGRSSCGKESKFSSTLNCKKQRLLTNGA